MTESKTLVLVVTPTPPSDLRSLFSDQPNSIRRALADPPDIRPRGWGLRTGGSPRTINGEFVQVESGREVIDLYRDGQLIVASRIGSHSLAWADNTESRIHPLAFVEFVTNAFIFYRLVLADMRITPQALHIDVQLHNLIRNSEPMHLPAGGVNNFGWTSGQKSAPESDFARSIVVDAPTYDPERTAFLALREVYIWFGHTEEEIPYATESNDARKIDVAAIKAIG